MEAGLLNSRSGSAFPLGEFLIVVCLDQLQLCRLQLRKGSMQVTHRFPSENRILNIGGRIRELAVLILHQSFIGIAAAAALIGAVANTFRLELVDIAAVPPTVAAFLGSMVAGIMASLLKNRLGYPRISITVPSIVIMVPGLYLYRAVYNLGTMSLSVSASWFASAMLIIVALPLGLIFARILTDRSFRYCT